MADTIPGNTGSFQILSVDTSASSAIDFAGDADWWRVSLVSGYGYRVWVEGSQHFFGTLVNPYLAVYNNLSAFQVENNDRGLGEIDAFLYLTPTTGTFFLSAEAWGNATTGTYTITLQRDTLETTGSAAAVGVNATVNDRIDLIGDIDWIGVPLTAGVTYQFDMVGSTADGVSGAFTLADPWLALRNGVGTLQAANDNDGVGLNARITFTPLFSGTYFLDAQEGGANASGSYRIIVNSSPVAGAIVIGTPTTGTVDFAGDTDQFSVFLTAGTNYTITLTGSTLIDPFLEVLDSSKAVLNYLDDSGLSLDPSLTFTPATSGTYYLAARASGNTGTGSYSLNITADTIPGNTSSLQTLAIGTSATSAIDFAGDTDWWRATMLTGYGYQIWVEGNQNGFGNLVDPYLAIYNNVGVQQSANDNISFALRDAYINFIPSNGGTFFLSAEESGNNATGSYTITAWRDTLGSVASATSVAVNGSYGELIGWQDDTSDWIFVVLTAGITYQFDLIGWAADGAAMGLTLVDPLLNLRNSAGSVLSSNDNSGAGLNARIVFTPQSSGTYFLDAQESGNNASGSYRVLVNSAPVASAISLGVPINAGIDFAGDIDQYSVQLTAGTSYVITLNGTGLADPFLELLDANKNVVDYDDDSGAGLNSTLSFAPSNSGTYYLVARAAGNASSGFYSLSIISPPTLSIANATITEGNSGVTNLLFTVTLSSISATPVSVTASTSGVSTATSGADYVASAVTVTVPAGNISASFSVQIWGDTQFEPTEVFYVNLTNPVGAVLDDARANGFIFDNDSPYVGLPTDANLTYQWALYDTTGVDVFRVWPSYTGRGVRVVVFDQGVDATNPDLQANVLTGLGRNAADLTPGGAPVQASDNHGTAVAGLIVGAADGNPIIGVAYGANVVPIYSPLSLSFSFPAQVANAFTYAQGFDVLNNSWGSGNLFNSGTNYAFFDDFSQPQWSAAAAALKALADLGRGGLGTVVVQSAGNTFSVGDDTNLHSFQNSRYIITVGATDYAGHSSPFSSPGASVLVSAPGGEGGDAYRDIWTTDRTGASGYRTGNTVQQAGTSFSSPIVAGVVALMLEANPALGYRDIQEILAYSARLTDRAGNDWEYNGARDWNGGGLHFDSLQHDLGFGLVDAAAAVRLAETWRAVARTSSNVSEISFSQSPHLLIPDNGLSTGAGGAFDFIQVTQALRVERVEVTLNVTHPWVGDMYVLLSSPSDTTSFLISRPGAGELSAFGSSQDNIHFTFDTVLGWGESSLGTWKLGIFDFSAGLSGSFDSWTLKLIGSSVTADDLYVYTDEFAQAKADQPGRATLIDAAGVDTLNAAACSARVLLDLRPGSSSTIAGQNLALGATTVIENAFGGDGNDTLIGNSVANELHGTRGNDTLTGGGGNDVFGFHASTDGIDRITDFTDGDSLRLDGANLAGPLTAGSGIGLARNQIQLSSTSGVTSIYIGIDNTPGSDLRIDLTGTFSAGQLRASGTDITFNHAPTPPLALTAPAAQAGSAFAYSVPTQAFTDPDAGDSLVYSAQLSDGNALPAWLFFNAATRAFSGTPGAANVGSLSVRVAASDGGLSANAVFALVVSAAANLAPVAANGSATTAEDTVLNAALPAASDGNGDPITYAKASNPVHGGLTVGSSGSYTYSPAANYVGADSFTFTVSDGKGGSNTYAQTLTITAVNDAPVVAHAIPDQNGSAGSVFGLVLNADAFADVDDTILSYSASLESGAALPAWLAFNAATRAFSGTPANSNVGSVNIKVTASDGLLSASDVFTIAIAPPPNAAPVASPGSGSTAEDMALIAALPVATDIDGDAVTYTKASDPVHGALTVGGGGNYTYSPAPNYFGADSFTFTVSDGKGGSNTYTQALTVTAVNDAPVVASPIPDQRGTAGTAFVYAVNANAFTDVDNISLSYSAALESGAALPAWLAFNSATRTFSGNPAAANIGSLNLKVTASDGSLAVSDVFVLTVIAQANRAPTAANGNANLAEDSTISGALPAAVDLDGDAITYVKTTNPSHGSLTVGSGGSYTYAPFANYAGNDSFGFSVADGKGGSNAYSFSLTVTPVVDTLVGSAGADNLIGFADADVINGKGGTNSFTGLGGNDTLLGGSAIDTAIYTGPKATATYVAAGFGWTVTTPTDGTDTLFSIERLKFADTSVALDINGSAGGTAKIIGAVFGSQFLTNQDFVGIGIQLLDGGMLFADLVALATSIDLFKSLAGSSNGVVSNSQFVNLIYQNITGAAPSAGELATFVGLLDRGDYTQGALAVLACNSEVNALHIDLVGLSHTGIEFVPQPGG